MPNCIYLLKSTTFGKELDIVIEVAILVTSKLILYTGTILRKRKLQSSRHLDGVAIILTTGIVLLLIACLQGCVIVLDFWLVF